MDIPTQQVAVDLIFTYRKPKGGGRLEHDW